MKIISFQVRDGDIWALTDDGHIFIRRTDSSWEDLTEDFHTTKSKKGKKVSHKT